MALKTSNYFIGLILALAFQLFAPQKILAQSPQENELRVIGLFKNAAMVDFAGKQKLYRAGQKINADIQLIKADTHSATFSIHGKEQILTLHKPLMFSGDNAVANAALANADLVNKVNSQSTTSTSKVVKIQRGLNGMYETPGLINGVLVNFLVDTGATYVAMSRNVANRLGIPYLQKGIEGRASTANGEVRTWIVTLDSVRVGDIELYNVRAGVSDNFAMGDVLLGMSFINRVKLVNEGATLELIQQY
ncbi:retropepsin-like aspartic protease family protein [Aliikangiella maris]|uniref:Retropepsin-like aspartic protease n=2 Tax=Aliikangiella maris TaxID=3162458 RepID=A0ABV3MTY2_9GAMM